MTSQQGNSASVAAPPQRGWWERRDVLALLVVLTAVPLLWPAIPPLTDVMGHMGTFRIELAAPESPLQQWYRFDWRPVGNLGFDLLIRPLAPLFGLERAVKLLVIAVPVLTVAGMLLLAREVHGRVPATALFALPFAWAWPVQFGFMNFALAMALALIGFALWLRMERLRLRRRRALLFAAIALALWLVHSFGWATLGLFAFAAELSRVRRARLAPRAALVSLAISLLPFASPVLLMVLFGHGAGPAAAFGYRPWWFKVGYLLFALRADAVGLDLFSVVAVVALAIAGLAWRRLHYAAPLGLAAALLGFAYLALPFEVMNGTWVDMRMAPYALAMAMLALSPDRLSFRGRELLALAGLALFVTRIGVSTVALARIDGSYTRQLAALDHLPRGARVFALVDLDCFSHWEGTRMDHLGAMAIVRREAFVNGQWSLPGVHPLRIRFPAGDRFTGDGTQVIRPGACERIDRSHYPQVLSILPRDAFDYLWLIDFPPDRLPRRPWLQQVWAGERGALYRIQPTPRAAVPLAPAGPGGVDAR